MLEALKLECVRGERRLFSGVSFSLGVGEALQVFGPNGSGKSSLLRIVAGLLPPAAGEVRWRRAEIRAQAEDYRREMLYLGHLNGIKDELTALENLRVLARLSGVAATRSAATDALARLGLGGREDLPAKVLSQGQKRRLALSRLLLAGACLWILDEPLTSLDREAAAEIEAVLAAHLSRGGITLIATHQAIELHGAVSKRLNLPQ
jgi:heme exporter protein A